MACLTTPLSHGSRFRWELCSGMQSSALQVVSCFKMLYSCQRKQAEKYYFEADSSMTDNSKIASHTAEVLRQVEGAGIEPGAWVGGDAWFGSVMTAVEVMKRKQVHSTWLIKNNSRFYPKQVLYSILKARFGDHPAGHWVVMETTISDVPIFAFIYAWSQSNQSYFLSTCGSTLPAEEMYQSKFQIALGINEYLRPDIAHFLFDRLPLIDEHNKQRQSILSLETSWQTQDCWFRLLTTLVGMCVVDMHRIWRNQTKKVPARPKDDIEIKKFSDMLCGSLQRRERRKTFTLAQQIAVGGDDAMLLTRIRNLDGSTTRPPTQRQANKRSVGTSRQMKCFICRKYLNADGTVVYNDTSMWCKSCEMPLCLQYRSNLQIGRPMSCVQEHVHTLEALFACGTTKHVRGTRVQSIYNLIYTKTHPQETFLRFECNNGLFREFCTLAPIVTSYGISIFHTSPPQQYEELLCDTSIITSYTMHLF